MLELRNMYNFALNVYVLRFNYKLHLTLKEYFRWNPTFTAVNLTLPKENTTF